MMNIDERYRTPRSTESVPDHTPALWNPNAAALWSLLLSPIFGAVLHMLNARAMGDRELEKLNKFFIWGILAVILIGVPASLAAGIENNFIGLVMLMAWYGAAGRKQVAVVKEQFGDNYPRKPWGKAIGLGIAGIVALMLYGALTGMLMYWLGLYAPQ